MIKKSFYVVNSFAEKSFEGNPAAVFINSEDLNSKTMQSIAKQMNLVETVFVNKNMKTDDYDFELRYFTPEKELPLAGHPTIAAFVALNNEGCLNKNSYRIKTLKGIEEVFTSYKEDKFNVMLKAPTPVFKSVINDIDNVAKVLGINPEDINCDMPMQIIDTGFNLLIVPVKSLKSLMQIRRNIAPLKQLCTDLNFNEVQAFTFETYDRNYTLHTRNICPREGIEDPGCGVGNAAVGAYLMKYKYTKLNEIEFSAEQGIIMNMPCFITIHPHRINNEISIEIGGTGRIMINGNIFI